MSNLSIYLYIVFQILFVVYIPDQTRLLGIANAFLLHQGRLDRLQKGQRRSGIPMRHSACVFWVHEVALECLAENFLAKLSSVFERPEEVAVVIFIS